MKRIVLLALGLVAAGLAAAPLSRAATRRPESDVLPLGFTETAWDQESEIEGQYASLLDPARISRTHRELTREPHRAGTEGDRRVVLYIKQEAVKAGFRPEIAEYLFYNSHPGPRSIELTAPIKKPLSLAEDRIPGDPFTERAADHLGFCAYSGSGTAEGDVVYVGQGTVAEFRALRERGVSLEGRVALMRYFGEGEGRKVLRAQEEGAVAAILYADPLEDGFVQGPVYPQGDWRPPGSIMRRSLVDTPYEGDPLSPGWAALPGAKRLDPQKVEGLPRIPVLPISYRDAALILAFWDAEEMALGGSTEWAEDNAEILRRKGAAVINMDSAVFNGERPLYAGASPCLHRLFREVAADVPGPRGKESLFAAWVRLQNAARELGSVDAFAIRGSPSEPLVDPQIDDVPLGDDQTPFVEFLALPGSDMYYGADYGLYHSLYEDRHWMETVVDPQFRHHRVMAELQGRLGLRLATAPLLPLDPAGTAAAWDRAFGDLRARAAERQASPRLLRPVERALKRFREAARAFARERDETLTVESWPLRPIPDRLASISREVAETEKAFFSEHGLPGDPWHRGLWVAPPRSVPGLTEERLPGLRWPLELDQEGVLLGQVSLYTQALDEATSHLHRAQGLLTSTSHSAMP